MIRPPRFLAALAFLALMAADLSAQSIYASLTGVVSDPSDALIVQATVKLRDMQSGSLRDTVTNNQGFYSFVSVPVGTYELTISAAGFETYRETNLALGGGERRNVNAVLKVGATTENVVISDTLDLLVPVDSGEKSTTLNTKQLQNFVQVGSNAAEYIKIMPGFGIQNGISNAANYNGATIGINANGNAGSQSPLNNAYAYNGLPGNTLDITADGAHVSDPGCNCDTPVNPNADMVAEFKITMSNFNAENQKGPAVISTVAKSGGRNFHGSGFLYARDYNLNANDWQNNSTGTPRPQNKYYYPGFTIGGPLYIPHTNFNRSHNKLFFFTGYEYFYQVLDTGLLRSEVPTPGMITGNFSPAELAKLGNISASGSPPNQINSRTAALYPGGIIPASAIDPNMQALMKLYPAPNADPTGTGYNWVGDLTFNQNNHQWMTRVDYNVSDNTKLFVRYNLQREVQRFPVQLWANTQTQQLPYPTQVLGKNRSDSVTASLTHVFSPSMTNEFVFGYTFIGFPNVFEDPSKVDPAKVGFNNNLLYKNGVAQIPNFQGGSELAKMYNYGGFEVGGTSAGLYANKWLPSFSDTVSKVFGRHTFKAGVFFEYIRNAQPASSATNGTLTFTSTNSNSLGNDYADMLVGNLNSFSQNSFNRVNDIAYKTYEGFVQDSWKVNKRLTVELGIRLTHFTPWVDRLGFGFSIFDPSKYNTSCTPTQYCGFIWNNRDKSVPMGGFPTRAMFYQPRFGVAYDVFGNGKTVIRGGWGMYYFHSGQFTSGLDVAAGVQTITLSNNQGAGVSPYVVGGSANATPLMVRDLPTLNFSSAALSPGAVDKVDDRQPLTKSYSFTIAQRLPWSSLVEVAYVGNQSTDLLNTAGGQGSNVNLVPVGAMLVANNGGVDPNSLNANNFRPIKAYSNINLATHNWYANYNSMQVTWVRTKGRYTLSMNYTFAKALGIITSTLDSYNLANNYGVMPSNRTHLFNLASSVELGNPVKNRVAGGFVNGWQLSGILQLQSGANLTGNRSQNFGLNLNSYKIPGTTYNVSNTSVLGTPNIQLNPILTCDPTANLASNQYINGSCFAIPQVGQNGPTTLPVIYGPAFFNADLGLFKNFSFSESKKLQFRFNGYNFLNHPLWSFPSNTNLTLGYNGTTGVMNNTNFGYVTQKQGRRTVQLAVKFIF